MKPKTTKSAAPRTAAAIFENGASSFGESDRLEQISTAAYYKAEARGFAPGGEINDWLAAETEYYSAMQ